MNLFTRLPCRIADLCRELSQPVLLSAEFVAAVPASAEILGEFPIRGSEAPEQIYLPVGRST